MSQIFNETENKKMPTSMGLDEKVSDLVGVVITKLMILGFKFCIDQNDNDFNYKEIDFKLILIN